MASLGLGIDAVNQGNWSLSIKFILECFVIVKLFKYYAKTLTFLPNDSKIQGCIRCQYFVNQPTIKDASRSVSKLRIVLLGRRQNCSSHT